MNDCFWCFINGCCNGEGCANCKQYLSVNSEEGGKMYDQYSKEVEEHLAPLYEKYNKKMKEYNNEKEK